MVLYNVTIKVDPEIEDSWVEWMKDVHIPDVMRTGYFSRHFFWKLVGDQDLDQHTYAIQYHCRNIEALTQYVQNEAPRLRQDVGRKFGKRYIAFRTVLEEV